LILPAELFGIHTAAARVVEGQKLATTLAKKANFHIKLEIAKMLMSFQFFKGGIEQ
jgi:hypothetical protein